MNGATFVKRAMSQSEGQRRPKTATRARSQSMLPLSEKRNPAAIAGSRVASGRGARSHTYAAVPREVQRTRKAVCGSCESGQKASAATGE